MDGNQLVAFALGVLLLASALLGWAVRHLVGQVKEYADLAARSHVLAVLERERCERILNDCREARAQCATAAGAACEAAADAEEFAESIEPDDDQPEYGDEGRF